MKKKLCILIATLKCTFLLAQTYHNVDNSQGSTTEFKTINAAIDAASDGDVILIHPGQYYNEIVEVDKKLTLIGTGYDLGLNEDPFSQANKNEVLIRQIKLDQGGSGTVISSVALRSLTVYRVSDILITRIKKYYGFNSYNSVQNSSNVKIEKSLLYNPLSVDGADVEISNNIIFAERDGVFFRLGGQATTFFDKNVIVNNTETPLNLRSTTALQKITMENNIIVSDQISIGDGTKPLADYNLFLTNEDEQAVLDVISGGNNTVSPVSAIDNVFIGYPDNSGLAPDEIYKLANNSPALNAAKDGTNLGAFQENNGYVLSGIPFIPNIYKLELGNPATTQEGVVIKIAAKANSAQ